ncbi:MAG: phage late control D family protein [Clostridiales Family XIII bacterium]|jgi:hypothetical protein|nr:phage late control D family protein [Clostridiales Family XIII bacterium]
MVADLTTLRIKSPYGIESILSLSLSVRPNEHAVLRLSGYCSEEEGFNPLVSRSCENDAVELYEEEDDGKKLLFRGIAGEIEMSAEGGMYRVYLTVYSHSILLDEEKKSRSFQDTEMTYDALFRAVSEDTGILLHKGAGEKIKTPATRYKETDFEFLSRMAGRLNTSVYPDVLTPNLHIGLPGGTSEDLGSDAGYGMNKDIERYMREKANGADLNDIDLVSFTVSDKKHRRIGDVLVFKGRPFGIVALSAELVRGELVYTYTLAEESYIYSEDKPSPLKGMSLEGKVIERQDETVKLHLDIDETQDKERAYSYPYAPITGRAMYAMPVVGEKVRLYFPDGREENAFVQDCVRGNGDTCENTADPNVRYFRSEYGPELMMAPSKLHFKETKPSVPGLYFEIDDDFGIRLKSHRNININADGHVEIRAGGAVRFSAPALVRFNQMSAQRGRGNVPALPESSFSYENDTHMFAGLINQRGLSRTSYAPFPSAAPAASTSGRSFGKASPPKKEGFNWGGLLAGVAVVAVCTVAAAASVATFGAGAVIGGALVGAALGAACAAARTSSPSAKGRYSKTKIPETKNEILKKMGHTVMVADGARTSALWSLYFAKPLPNGYERQGIPLWHKLLGEVGDSHYETILRLGAGFSNVMSGLEDYMDDRIALNYEYNTQFIRELSDGKKDQYEQETYYLNGQGMGDLAKFKMGLYTAENRGCGWIATYNALSVLDRRGESETVPFSKVSEEQKKIADIIKYYDKNGGLFNDGEPGINIVSVTDYFRNTEGVKTTYDALLPYNVDERIRDSTVSILQYKHSTGVHYVTVKYDAEDKQYHIYNEFNNVISVGEYKSIDQWGRDEAHLFLGLITLDKEEEAKV